MMNKFIQNELNVTDSMKRASGTVISIVPNTDGGKAVVNVMNRKLTLLNKSGENLEINDTVWVYYWTDISNGYIALRNGLPNSRAEGNFSITTAVVMTERQSQALTVADTIIDVDYQNHLTAKYGNPQHSIVASGMPVYICNYTSSDSISSIYPTVSEIPASLLSIEREVEMEDCYFYSIINGTFNTANDRWGLSSDVIAVLPDQDQGGSYSVTTYCSGLFNQYGNAVRVDSFTDLGMCFLTAQINGGVPHSDYPYGYATCRLVNIGKYVENGETKTAISRVSTQTYKLPFATQAEYDYAITVHTRSSIHIDPDD